MSGYDTPDQVEARKNMFSRFARLQALQAEKRRPKIQLASQRPKAPSEEHYNTWRHETEQAIYESKELEYILPYTAEYSTGVHGIPSMINEDAEYDQHGDCLSNADTESTIVENNSILRAGAKIRARVRNQLAGRSCTASTSSGFGGLEHCSVGTSAVKPSCNGTRPHAPSTCRDFDQTSTVVPPSEAVEASDFNSNVSIYDLKKRYFTNYTSTQNLPIYKQRKQIIDSINSYSVVIIEGSTGCGKTTQVPMYILEDAIQDRPSDKGAPVIYVTQPRRIAAKSIAQRVCSEHNWVMPSIVGYQVSLEKEVGPETVLVFCTAGVLLQKIIQEKSLKKYTHIIIDEAHERDADTDLLMMMIRKLMLTEMPLFRLIIMSATMDIDKLKNYFTFRTHFGHQSETTPSYILVGSKERAATNLQTVYLDTLRAQFGVLGDIPEFDLESPELHDECLQTAVKIVVEVVPLLENFNESSSSTLVFLPGLAEISRLDAMIKKCDGAKDHLDIIPLHSCLTVMDQFKVFQPSRPGCRKVILATNIAESSITVPDVGFIIDFCLTKTLMKDAITRFPTLKLYWSSQDKCIQRAGRTGRCCPGKVFRMVPSNFFKQFRKYAEPELLTAPLEISVLRVKNFQMGEIKALFAIVMDPPPYNEIRTAVLELKQIGALAATYKGHLSDIDGDLTELGRVITVLPIDVHLSKLIVVASVFDVLDDAIIVAACLSTNRTVVRFMYGNSIDSYEIKLDWSRGSQSDLFVSLDCYKEFHELKAEKGRHDRWLASWCAKNHLDERKLHDVDAMVSEIKKRLENVNIFSGIDQPNKQRDPNMDNLMLKLSFCAAFYPNYFITEPLDTERITKELCGSMDTLRTVVISGIPVNQVPIYKSQIIGQLRETVCQELDYIADVSRAYLVLKDDDEMSLEGMNRVAMALEEDKYQVIQHSRTIPKAVYKALKYGEYSEIQIREYKDSVALKRMLFYNNQKQELAEQLTGKLIPSCMKVLDEDQTADNSNLVRATDTEYAEITAQAPYFEVDFDVDQDAADIHALYELEAHERKQDLKSGVSHDTFKTTYKRVRGPDSPLRMSFRSILVKSMGYTVELDTQSVNSILLDSEYSRSRRQMLVAATVTQSKRGRVSARDTTLMPNIRGLPTIMALLFAQYYRLIHNKELNCIAGGVFGIGWTKDDVPLDRQYEVDLSFDVHMTKDDIELINKARGMMSELLKFTEIHNAGRPQASLQSELRKVILALVRKRRYPLAELDMSMVDHKDAPENIFIKDIHNLPDDIIQEGAMRPFLPLMKYNQNLSEWKMYESIRANLNLLGRIEKNDEPMPVGGIKCLVCGNGQKCCFIMALNVDNHLRSDRHKENVTEFELFEKRARQNLANSHL